MPRLTAGHAEVELSQVLGALKAVRGGENGVRHMRVGRARLEETRYTSMFYLGAATLRARDR